MSPGSIALIRFPFSDSASAKKRPALVLVETRRSPRNRLVTVAMITSQVEGLRIPGDVDLADWESANLLHPSLLRLAKLATVDMDLLDKRIGELSARDRNAARAAFRQIFAAWVK